MADGPGRGYLLQTMRPLIEGGLGLNSSPEPKPEARMPSDCGRKAESLRVGWVIGLPISFINLFSLDLSVNI
jgi:hypothetical protein